MKPSLFSLLAGTAIAGSVTSLGEYRVFESLPAAPAPWILKDDVGVDPGQSFKLRIHLKNRNIASFHQKVIHVSTPDHPEYGRHLSRVEVNDMLAPSKDSFDSFLEWLELQGLSNKATIENDWIVVDGTIGDAQTLLQTEYRLFEDSETGKVTARTLEYSLPASLHSHVDIIAPTIKFTTPSAQRSTIVKDFAAPAAKLSTSSVADIHDGLNVTACNVTITPDCLYVP
jgi:tripeptidyl-peptidase-1